MNHSYLVAVSYHLRGEFGWRHQYTIDRHNDMVMGELAGFEHLAYVIPRCQGMSHLSFTRIISLYTPVQHGLATQGRSVRRGRSAPLQLRSPEGYVC